MSARRPWAWPLVPAYRAGIAIEPALYRAGLLQARTLPWPVISVGSLSAGGAGKTPVVISLAGLLREHGWHTDVLSRGYGRTGRGVERVNLLGAEPDQAARRFGDEPVLIAERTGVPVWVGADRFAAGEQAEAEAQPDQRMLRRAWRDKAARASRMPSTVGELERMPSDEEQVCVHLLDDGLQHRRLTRNFEIVLLTAEDLADALLPAGNLREPFSALLRADAIVVREEEREAIEGRIRELTGGGIPMWSVRRSLRFPAPLGIFSAGLRPLAFCAIARPEGFAAMLTEAGCGVVDTVIFPDHHSYSPTDADRIVEIAHRLNATGLVTTEKDSVKLSPAIRQRLESVGPLAVVALEAEFVYKAPVIRALETRLRTKDRNQDRRGREDSTAAHTREARLR